MKNLRNTVLLLALSANFIVFPAMAENSASAQTGASQSSSTASKDTKSTEAGAMKKSDTKKSPYFLQQPKQQQNNKHKSEKMFDKKAEVKQAN